MEVADILRILASAVIFTGLTFGSYFLLDLGKSRRSRASDSIYIHDPDTWQKACRIAAEKLLSGFVDSGACPGSDFEIQVQRQLSNIEALADRFAISVLLERDGIVDNGGYADVSRLPDIADAIIDWLDAEYGWADAKHK